MAYFRPAAAAASGARRARRRADVPIWILGSSLFGAQLAAALGLPFAFASHFAPAAADARRSSSTARRFKPSEQLERPYVMLGVNVFAAETDDGGAAAVHVAAAGLRQPAPRPPGRCRRPIDGYRRAARPPARPASPRSGAVLLGSRLARDRAARPGGVRRPHRRGRADAHLADLRSRARGCAPTSWRPRPRRQRRDGALDRLGTSLQDLPTLDIGTPGESRLAKPRPPSHPNGGLMRFHPTDAFAREAGSRSRALPISVWRPYDPPSQWALSRWPWRCRSRRWRRPGDFRAQVEKVSQAWATAYNAGDAAAITALYTKDAKVMAPGAEPVSGTKAIQALFAADMAGGVKQTLTRKISWALATTRSRRANGWPPPPTASIWTTARMYALQEGGGGWKLYRDTWNSSMKKK